MLKKEFDIDVDKLNRFLKIQKFSIPSNFNIVEACRLVYKDPTMEGFVKKVNRFDVHTRLLHLMVAQTLNPRAENYAHVNNEEIYWLSRIIERKPSNVGEHIARRMVKAM